MELDFDSDPEVCTPFYIGNIFSFKNSYAFISTDLCSCGLVILGYSYCW